MGDCKNCTGDCSDSCDESCGDMIDHDEVLPRWLAELKLKKKRLEEAASRQQNKDNPKEEKENGTSDKGELCYEFTEKKGKE